MRAAVAAVLLALLGLARAEGPPPWQRTETRAPCAATSLWRNPYFGDLHVHTRFSADAYIFGTRVEPRDAYAFARGGTVVLPDENEGQTRTARIERPLDFMAVTDHSEWFGEALLCATPGSLVYDFDICKIFRQVDTPDPMKEFGVTVQWLFPAGIPNPPPSLPFCTTPGVDCDAAAVSVWQTEQAAAEEAYDRTAVCRFTSFVGYEHTASPLGRHQHRNVIFRNATVPPFAKSQLETAAEGFPRGLWSAVEKDCLNAHTGCDAVIIPHNPNLSGGMQFVDPSDAMEALRRQTLEPLVEIHQIKGNSECRFDRLAGAGLGNTDELCTFEQDPLPHQGPDATALPIDQYPRRNMVRNALEDGLGFEQKLGVNPFRMGFIGSTDNHDGTGGNVSESGWPGGQGGNDAGPATQVSRQIRTNPGGLAVAWAEENSRDAIFSALRRRETYATSGTRPVVRFFGGDLARVACGAPDFVRDAYATGTPMGGELGPVRGRKSPRFAVWAMKDPGTAERPGTDLQRVQIVKGWVDAKGNPHEQVFDVAGDAKNGAGVDPATCAPRGAGASELCSVWQDPDFDRRQRAFYYARVLENPTCRWSTFVCRAAGVDPLSPSCATQAAAAGAAYANCCLGPANDAFAEPVVQERAWTSPIWYRPEAIARLRAAVRFGSRPGTDTLTLRLTLGQFPKSIDLRREAVTVSVTDDDEIFSATLQAKHRSRPRGVRTMSFDRHAATLTLATGPLDLAHADRSDHMVTVALAAGTFRASETRLWVVRGNRLVPGDR